jgi:YesN/AraC family two-component response regulator
MIVELHHGCIKAQNRTDTHGTCFTVRIPHGKEHLSQAELIESEVQNVSPVNTKKKKTNSRYKILVVDDDEEMGNYISSELSEFFKFGICKNGNEAMAELLNELNYDLVISDVMMPGMDGFTLVKTIKSNCKISHIPVILLTSKSDIDNRLVGIEKGADAFLAKPFNMDELHVTINTLINNMLRLKGKFSGAQQQTDKIEEKDLKSNNDVLMERIMKAINKNISSPDFNVDKLTEDVGISRAQLHRKMKEMTGIPASEFIRNLRLDQAAKLLREHKVNVTQVAYAVGFSNQAHFSTVFHKHFGVSPSEYVERQNGITE